MNLDELRKIVLFAIGKIAPERLDLIRDVEKLCAPAMTASKSYSSNSRAEGLAYAYYMVANRTGEAKEQGEKELRSVILGQYLPLMFPDCVPLSRMIELYDEVEGISLRYVNGEITEQEYKDLLAGK